MSLFEDIQFDLEGYCCQNFTDEWKLLVSSKPPAQARGNLRVTHARNYLSMTWAALIERRPVLRLLQLNICNKRELLAR
jgi:hypothetical protein